MTRIEMEVMQLIKSACRKYIESKQEIDWEQRRYEIAKDCFVMQRSVTAREAVALADQLIAELKKEKED